MMIHRKLAALLGLLLSVVLVAGATGAAHASAGGLADAKAAVKEAKADVRAAQKKQRSAREARDSAKSAASKARSAAAAASSAYDAALAAQAAANVDAQNSRDVANQREQAYVEAVDVEFRLADVYNNAEQAVAAADRDLQAEKDQWANCTRASGSFMCRRTASSPWVPVPALDNLYNRREAAAAQRDEDKRQYLLAVDRRVGAESDRNNANAAASAADARLAAATAAADGAAATKQSADAKAKRTGNRLAAAQKSLKKATKKLAKAEKKLERAKAHLRDLT